MFQVETDQLKVSNGWVRCGQCDGVFDASAHFQVLPQAPATDVAPNPESLYEPPAPASQALSPEPLPDPAASLAAAPRAPVSDALSSYLSSPNEEESHQALSPPAAPLDSDARRALYGREPKNLVITEAPRGRKAEVSFINPVQARVTRSRPWLRILAVLVPLALLLLFLVQFMPNQRDALAARYPVLLPAVETLCLPLKCQVSPPRIIEAVAIDSSSFTQVGPDSYRLNFVLQNKQSSAVAMPALEVTLTGIDDQPLLRKIVLPAEFGATSDWLYSASTFTGAFEVRTAGGGVAKPPPLDAPQAGEPAAKALPDAQKLAGPLTITGYRLLAFYP
jgi:hypothetical protein